MCIKALEGYKIIQCKYAMTHPIEVEIMDVANLIFLSSEAARLLKPHIESIVDKF